MTLPLVAHYTSKTIIIHKVTSYLYFGEYSQNRDGIMNYSKEPGVNLVSQPTPFAECGLRD